MLLLLTRQTGICIAGVMKNYRRKGMDFNKTQVYTSLNASELRAGDKVICADTLKDLRNEIKIIGDTKVDEIVEILDESTTYPFRIKDAYDFAFAYLVERAENCVNCGKKCCTVRDQIATSTIPLIISRCDNWEPENKREAKPSYRPFKSTDELIQTWLDKGGKWQKRELTMPFIWVRRKDNHTSIDLITGFGQIAVSIGIAGNSMQVLFDEYEFLDGSPCGVISSKCVEENKNENIIR